MNTFHLPPQRRRELNNTAAASAFWCSGWSSSHQLPLAYSSTAAQNCIHARVVCTFAQEGMRPICMTVLIARARCANTGNVGAHSACAQKQREQHSADGEHRPQHLKVIHLHS